ncbi:CDP-glycerol glycerophosphotransferase family protein [Pueribacillus sp. YX66]|uniref:CDP-glycerol glycerophosphotransferase family protein n=1 Tax=Pueribacillus sp. YX66 TaxID=3229242 RepID=UPI00358D3E26
MKQQMLYSNLIDVIIESDKEITIYLKKVDVTAKINLDINTSTNRSYLITENYNGYDQIMCKLQLQNNQTIYVYVLNNAVYWINYSEKSKDGFKEVFDISIENYSKYINIQKKSFSDIVIDIPYIGRQIILDKFLTPRRVNTLIECELPIKDTKLRRILLGKIKFGINELAIYYYPHRKKLKIFKYRFRIIAIHENLSIELRDHNLTQIRTTFNDQKEIELTKKTKKIFPKRVVKKYQSAHGNILAIFMINRTKYFIYLRQNGVYLSKDNPEEVTQFKSNLRVLSLGKHFYIYGRMVHHAYQSFGKYDFLYVSNTDHLIAKFKRPFKRVKFLKQFGYFKIKASDLDLSQKVHYPLYLGSNDYILHNFPLKVKEMPLKVYATNKINNKIVAMRTNIHNQATYSIVPYSPMYSFSNTLKIKLAKFISIVFFKTKKYNVNLYFEKQASKADESGFRVFEKVKELDNLNSKNFFVLDKKADNYYQLKNKYGKDIIKRFSFRHYLSIFNADFFISSELSNHVINDRIFVNSIINKIKEVPLVFLQHGIMFAKPVENPMAKIFHKDFTAYNIYKNVVSSKLEAKEFYKMGYDDTDLLYTGLATFDFANLDKTSDKIVYMPTYRYWEEGMIYNGNIEQTTYYKSIIKVIKAFEKAGMRNNLMVVSHNKFSEYIYQKTPKYRDLLGTSPSNALKVARVFISDFSSAIYDAIYRGAYPIFYWEDKEYLITKYKAVPPVNEDNAPGPIAVNTNELIQLVENAIDRSYDLENEYKEKYKKINSFNDNLNTKRIIDFLLKDNIL